MSDFAPVNGIVGGSMVGLAASILLLGNGDALGCSNIVSTIALKPHESLSSTNQWRIVFLSSFLVTSVLIATIFPASLASVGSDILKTIPGYTVSNFGYCFAGLLVGFGTRLGNGCTSGHGICGLARLSIRSFAAVLAFMGTGIFASTLILPLARCVLMNSVGENDGGNYIYETTEASKFLANLITTITAILSIALVLNKAPLRNVAEKQEKDDKQKFPIAAISASIFSAGLAISGMIQQEKILGFLDLKGLFTGQWDGTLVMVMVGGIAFSAAGYHWVDGFNLFENENVCSSPMLGDKECRKFNIPPKNDPIDAQLLIGSACFGLGWGIGGFCPGPALFVAASGHPGALYFWWPFNVLGVFMAEHARMYLETRNNNINDTPLVEDTMDGNYGAV